MKQLKEALEQAGLINKNQILKDKAKEKVRVKHRQESVPMREDQIRIVCEACDKTAPDVERYDHTNRRIQGRTWLCIPCADEYLIDDQCRMTNQSTQSKKGMFRRQYGRTKRF